MSLGTIILIQYSTSQGSVYRIFASESMFSVCVDVTIICPFQNGHVTFLMMLLISLLIVPDIVRYLIGQSFRKGMEM